MVRLRAPGRLSLVVLAFVTACRPPTFLGAARVAIQVDPSSGIACVEVVALSVDTNTELSSRTDVRGRSTLHVGLSETPTFSGRVRVTVKGYAAEGCVGAPVLVLPSHEVTLGPAPFENATEFRFRRSAIDAGVDAGTDAGIAPGIDAGPGCTALTCAPASECETATCLDDGGCGREAVMPLVSCDGGACNGFGQCVPLSPCPTGMACSPGLSCTSTGTCSDAGSCVPSFAGCVPPPCHRTVNACLPDAGCAFEVDPTAIGVACTGTNTVCYANGECQPALRAANVVPARAPWPSEPMVFSGLPDGGNCNYLFETGSADGGTGPISSSTGCAWPSRYVPVILPQAQGPDVVVFSTTDLVVFPSARLFFSGKRPVALLVHGSARIQGQINARPLGPRPAPGADSVFCDAGIGGAGSGDREGGGGGGFLEAGGYGGRTGPTTRNGGRANGTDTLIPLRGGCSGGPGWGTSSVPTNGGGGLQLSVRNRLEVFDGGLITVSGIGGSGGDAGSAAAGGGSGGALLLQANDVFTMSAALTANGGGGGEGGTRTSSLAFNGDAGVFGSIASGTPASGGTGGNCCGGGGGSGGAGTTAPNNGNSGVNSGGNTPAGGGGGGSRGRIRIDTPIGGSCTLTTTVVSPADNYEGPNTSCVRQ
jgi:hypothetical protein